MTKETVSVIIPSYNSIKWVSDAIECILNQSYPFCEIIVVDDGSTDGTGELLVSKYGDSIKYVHQENKGLAGARNTGLQHAKGDYIQFLDADDLIHPDKIRLQVEVMQSMSFLSVSYTDYYSCDINELDRLIPGRYLTPVMTSSSYLEEIVQRWETKLSIPVHCFLFDARIFREHDVKFDEQLPNHEDWDCWMQVFTLNPTVRYIDKKMAIYRIHTNGMCYDLRRMREGFLMAIRKQKKLLAHNITLKKLLQDKAKQIRYIYREVGFWGQMFKHAPQKVKNRSARFIPWRIQRMFD